MTSRVSPPPAPKAASAQSPAQKPHANAAERFRESLAKAKSPNKPSAPRKQAAEAEPHGATPAALPYELRPDGTLVVTPYSVSSAAARAPSHATHAKVHSASVATAAIEQSQRDADLPIENVRVGRAGDTVRVHATVGQGEHQGVELRAVSRDGRVEVELRAGDTDAAQRLRSELASLRDSLETQGIERVSVTVVDASAESRGSSQPDSQRERRGREDETQEHPDALGAIEQRNNTRERQDPRDERDERDYLL